MKLSSGKMRVAACGLALTLLAALAPSAAHSDPYRWQRAQRYDNYRSYDNSRNYGSYRNYGNYQGYGNYRGRAADVQDNKNNMRNLGIAGLAVAGYGLINHDNLATALGVAGAALAGSQYENARQEQSQTYGSWRSRHYHHDSY